MRRFRKSRIKFRARLRSLSAWKDQWLAEAEVADSQAQQAQIDRNNSMALAWQKHARSCRRNAETIV